MSEVRVVEATGSASVHTKFSDLISYMQMLQTRAGVTLTTIGLAVTASGVVAKLLPLDLIPSDAIPIPIYVVIGAFTISILGGTSALLMPAVLRDKLFERLHSRELPTVDEVDVDLHSSLIEELRRKQSHLRAASGALEWGLYGLFIYGYVVLSFTFLSPYLPYTPVSPGGIDLMNFLQYVASHTERSLEGIGVTLSYIILLLVVWLMRRRNNTVWS